MKPFIQKIGVLAAMVPTLLSASAYDFEADGIFYNITNQTAKEVSVTFGGQQYSATPEYSGEVVVPGSVSYDSEQYTVTSIGSDAFRACSNMTSITIPGSVTTIGSNAFRDCNGLTSITIPNSVTTISDFAFSWCHGLTTVAIPNSVTTIESGAFYQCDGLEAVTISGSVTNIVNGAFTLCKNLVRIDVDADNQVYSSFDGILYNKPQTTLICCPGGKSDEVVIPNSVTTIGENAFNFCRNISSITLSEHVTTIENNAFSDCNSLTSITLAESVTTIGDMAFSRCFMLNSITLPNSLTIIGYNAFSDCNSLTSINIPGSVTTIGEGAFRNCYILTSIDVDTDNPIYSSNDGILFDKAQANLICCPEGRSGEVIIPNSVTAINDKAFSRCSSLTSIIIPNSVTTIGNEALDNCSGLTSITIPNSVTTIGYGAFGYCFGLTSITLSGSVTTIGWGTFTGCSNLTSITTLAVTPPDCGVYTFTNVDMQNCTLHVPAGCREAYQQAPEWEKFTLIEELDAVMVTEIRLNETEVNMEVAKTLQLAAEILPANATDKTLQWTSSDTNCVTVDENGLLTAVAQGVATITVRSTDGNAKATCAVKVMPTMSIDSVEASTAGTTGVFNLAGIKVADTVDNLPAGIYIANGHKFIVR